MSSYILTRERIRAAVDIVRPTIDNLLTSSLTKRSDLHLVVMCTLNPDQILYEESFGDKPQWMYPFDMIARGKARLCASTGMVARNVQKDAPWLYEAGDTRYVGGVIENGLIVAASGVQDHFDEMVSWMVLSAIQGLCRDYIANLGDDVDFFEDEG